MAVPRAVRRPELIPPFDKLRTGPSFTTRIDAFAAYSCISRRETSVWIYTPEKHYNFALTCGE